MPILHPSIDNPDELLAWPGPEGPVNRIQIERSDTGGGAGYANIGSVTIQAATRAYTFYDPNGDNADWYRWYVSNAGNTFPSSANRLYSEEQQPGETTPTATGAYATPVNVKTRLGIDDTDDDELLGRVCDQVNQWIETKTGRILAPIASAVYTFDGYDAVEGARCLLVPMGVRVVSLLEIAPYTGATFSTIPSTDYFVRPTTQERDPGWPGTELWMTDIPSASNPYPYFPPGFANVRPTMAAGWPAIPDDVIEVAEAVASRMFLTAKNGQVDQQGNAEFGASSIGMELWGKALHLIGKYAVKRVMLV
jgi:hypothetical protein